MTKQYYFLFPTHISAFNNWDKQTLFEDLFTQTYNVYLLYKYMKSHKTTQTSP